MSQKQSSILFLYKITIKHFFLKTEKSNDWFLKKKLSAPKKLHSIAEGQISMLLQPEPFWSKNFYAKLTKNCYKWFMHFYFVKVFESQKAPQRTQWLNQKNQLETCLETSKFFKLFKVDYLIKLVAAIIVTKWLITSVENWAVVSAQDIHWES